MPRRRFIFDAPDRFVAEAIGEPGHRAFYLQAAQGRRIVTVAIEKAQVAVLAERLSDLISEVERRGVALTGGTDSTVTKGLDEPIVEAFRVGAMTLTWDGQREALVVEAREIADEDEDADDDEESDDDAAADDDDDGPDLLRVQLSAPAARGFIARAAEVVSAGRLPCPFCGQPLNPEGHLCPRKNGYMH
jgi:uncharacterized repeat protein (TIGR03847 family)